MISFFKRVLNFKILLIHRVHYFLDPYFNIDSLLVKLMNYFSKFINKCSQTKKKNFSHNIHSNQYWDEAWTFWNKFSNKGEKKYYDYVLNLITENKDMKNIIELGCGPGFLIDRLKKNFKYNYIGSDFSRKSITIANNKIRNLKNFKVKVLDIKTHLDLLSKQKTDLIIAIDVIEHLKKNDLKKLFNFLNKRKIKFIFVTPYLNLLPSKEHVNFFSKKSLIRKINYSNLKFKLFLRNRSFAIYNF